MTQYCAQCCLSEALVYITHLGCVTGLDWKMIVSRVLLRISWSLLPLGLKIAANDSRYSTETRYA